MISTPKTVCIMEDKDSTHYVVVITGVWDELRERGLGGNLLVSVVSPISAAFVTNVGYHHLTYVAEKTKANAKDAENIAEIINSYFRV